MSSARVGFGGKGAARDKTKKIGVGLRGMSKQAAFVGLEAGKGDRGGRGGPGRGREGLPSLATDIN